MSTVTDYAHDSGGHSRTLAYVVVAIVLSVLTAMEVGASYVPSMKPILVPLLLVLSGFKFALVAMFYMHLKYDEWAFTAIFTPLLVLASFVIVVLMVLFGVYYHNF